MTPIEKTAQELNLPIEQVEMVVTDLFKSIREHISDLEKLKFGILLPIFRIDIKIPTLFKHVERLIATKDVTRDTWIEKIEYFKSILSKLPYSPKNTKHQRFKRVYNPDKLTY